jgi:Ni/Co efflux regulator RcnB
MQVADRRHFLEFAMSGAIVATAAAAGVTSVLSTSADAAPLAIDKALPERLNDPIEEAQWVAPAHRRYDRRWRRRHRRHRRRFCRWHRGRRICTWRWV